jgi:hypothetical protein
LLPLSLPLDYYQIILLYINNLEPIVLSLGNVNRSDIGYIGVIALSCSLTCLTINANFKYYLLVLFSGLLIFIAGSKIPIFLALLISSFYFIKFFNLYKLIRFFIIFTFGLIAFFTIKINYSKFYSSIY